MDDRFRLLLIDDNPDDRLLIRRRPCARSRTRS
jgi:hypothetical protein